MAGLAKYGVQGLPKFGEWDGDTSVPYTMYFDRARKGKGGAKGNHSADSQDESDHISSEGPAFQDQMARTKANPGPAKATDFSAPHDNASRKPRGRIGGKTSGAHKTRPDDSAENSPLNQHTPGRVTDKVGSTSPWRSKAQSEHNHDHASTTPGRSRLQKLDDEKVTAIPRFGDWDASDPSGAEVYTKVFGKVKDEKRNVSANGSYPEDEPQYSSTPPEANCRSWLPSCFKPTVYK